VSVAEWTLADLLACTCTDGETRHTSTIPKSVSVTDLRYLLDAESCPVERRNLSRILNARLADR
jgi:hypothetical protein